MEQPAIVRVLMLVVVGGLAVLSPVRGGPQEKGLLAYLKFDEGKGEVASDSSGNANHGEIRDAEWMQGEFGSALRFNGAGAHVTIPCIKELGGSEEMTVEVWVFWEGMGQYPNILTAEPWNPGGFMVFVNNDRCSFRLGRPGDVKWKAKQGWREVGANLVSPFSLGRWYHLAATFKRPAVTTYVNGKPVGAASWNFPVGCSGRIYIGKWGAAGLGPTMSHNGLIDEVKIYGRALTDAEIKASYGKEAPRRSKAAKDE